MAAIMAAASEDRGGPGVDLMKPFRPKFMDKG
jgi:hypothetical protein